MVLYRCEHCLKDFRKKCDYVRHKNKKYKCIDVRNLLENAQNPGKAAQNCDENSAEFKCMYCNKIFNRKYSLQRHIRDSCKELKKKTNSETTTLKNVVLEMKEEMKEMNKEIKKLRIENNQLIAISNQKQLNNVNSNNTNTNCNNTVNNTNVFITVPFGSEDYKRLTEEDKIDIMNYGKNCIQECFRRIHFNKSIPEFNNILHVDVCSNTVQVMGEENKPITLDIDDVVHTSFDNTWYFVDNLAVKSNKKFLNKCDKEWSKETQDHMKTLLHIPKQRDKEKEKIKVCMIDNTKVLDK